MEDDAALLTRWGNGDDDAGERLFERYFDPMHRFFASKVSAGSEDLVQRTFVACIEKHGTIREASSFRAFLYGIARFELLMYLRRIHADKEREIDPLASSMADLDPSPSQLVVEGEEQRQLLDALREVPVDLQIVIELHYWEELSTAEIASVLEIPQGTVKSRLRLARERLARALEPRA